MMTSSLYAAEFDDTFFGESLNGYNKKGVAFYSIDHSSYSTVRPTVTPIQGGGLFISVKVHNGLASVYNDQCVIELTVSAEGHVVGSQLRAVIDGQVVATPFVERRPEEIPLVEEGASKPIYISPTHIMLNELFSQFDAALASAMPQEKERKSLYSRLKGQDTGFTLFPAAVRHNVHLLFRSIR